MNTNEAIELVRAEREAQIKVWSDQQNTPFSWISILGEEYGHLCCAVNETHLDMAQYPEKGGRENIIREATHVAAIAVAILESIDEIA